MKQFFQNHQNGEIRNYEIAAKTETVTTDTPSLVPPLPLVPLSFYTLLTASRTLETHRITGSRKTRTGQPQEKKQNVQRFKLIKDKNRYQL